MELLKETIKTRKETRKARNHLDYGIKKLLKLERKHERPEIIWHNKTPWHFYERKDAQPRLSMTMKRTLSNLLVLDGFTLKRTITLFMQHL